MMEAASTSEKSVNFYQTTQRNISENSHLQEVTNCILEGFEKKQVLKFFLQLHLNNA
jgi:hypothetical protein